MVLAKTVITPYNTSIANALITQWKIVQGLIYKFELYFPPGSSGLVGVALHDASTRLYPYGELEYFIGDNVTISFEDEYFFAKATSTLDIVTYNIDDTYNHAIQVRLGIVSDEIIIRSKLGLTSNDSLTEPLAELIAILKEQSTTSYKNYDTSALGEL